MRLLLALLALAISTSIACGGGGGQSTPAPSPGATAISMDEYVQRIREARIEFEDRRAEIQVSRGSLASLPLDEQIEQVRSYLSDVGPLASELAQRVLAIPAPPAAQQANDALVIAAGDISNRSQAALTAIDSAETPAEVISTLASFESAVDEQLQTACFALQAAASAAGVELVCA